MVSLKLEKKYLAISRRVQDQQGDLATRIEESAVGFRVIKAFGRREHVKQQFDDGAVKLYGTSVDKVRLAWRFWTFLELIPNLTLVIVLLLGALAVGRDAITLGTLVAFITLMLSRTRSRAPYSVCASHARMYSGRFRRSFSRRTSDSTRCGSPSPKRISRGRW